MRREVLGVDTGVNAIEMAQSHHHLFQWCVAGAFAQTVDGGAGVGGACLQRRQGVGGGEPEIVMGVDFDFDVDSPAQLVDARERAEGIQQA